MSDPYAEWLDIPAHLRPPTHYQLLGIPPSELDPKAIAAAAAGRLARLREHAAGPRGDEARRVAREVIEARDTLVDPVSRLTYDTLAPDAADPWWKEEAAPPPPPETAPVEGWWQGEAPDPDAAPPVPSPIPQPDLLPPASVPVPPPLPAKANDWWKAPGPAPPPVRTTEPPAPSPAPVRPEAPLIHEQALALTAPGTGGSPVKWILIGLFLLGMAGAGAIYALRPPSDDPPPDNKQVAENKPIPDPTPPVVDPPDREETPVRPKPPVKGVTTPTRPVPPVRKDDPDDPPPMPEPKPPPPEPEDVVRPATLRGHKGGSVYGVAVGRDGQTILSISDDRNVLSHSRHEPGKAPRSLHRLISPGLAVVFCNDDKYAAFCDGGEAIVYDLAGGGIRATFENPRGGIRSLAAVPDGSLVLSGTTDGAVRIWNTKTRALDNALDVDDKATVTAVAVAPDGRTVVLGLSDGRVALWDLKGRREVKRWKGHTGPVTAVSVAPDGKRLLSAGDDGIANVWQAGGTLVKKLAGHTGPLAGAAWTADGARVVTAGTDKSARLWVENAGWKADAFGKLADRAFSLALDPRDRFAAIGLADGTVQIVPLPPGK